MDNVDVAHATAASSTEHVVFAAAPAIKNAGFAEAPAAHMNAILVRPSADGILDSECCFRPGPGLPPRA
eukprot:4031592-Pyramimonas_sp.AAC.2